jgi:hypothetical protein
MLATLVRKLTSRGENNRFFEGIRPKDAVMAFAGLDDHSRAADNFMFPKHRTAAETRLGP